MSDVVDRFLRYVKIDTQSSRDGRGCPSTEKQLDLARLLVEELQSIGVQNVTLDENGFVMATLPANTSRSAPIIGFVAHMDTSPDMSGANVKPQLIANYDGSDIVLNAMRKIILSPKEFPDLKKYVGQTLITTDGTTLLGADDKAGVAEIMSALKYLVEHPHIEHGTIRVAFTPDEEIGTGIHKIDLKKFGADFAYTLDGGEIGELQYENFNAAEARITIHGRNVHPGTAKNKMINAILVGVELNSMLPVEQRPEFTENYEGFFHLFMLQGTVEEARMVYIIREHNRPKFEKMKELLQQAVAFINKKYGHELITLELRDQYFNMRERIEPVIQLIHIAREAMQDAGVTPIINPVRGGTDGAQMTYMGLPTPNIFTGGHNYHGKYEFVPAESMEKAVEVIVNIAQRVVEP